MKIKKINLHNFLCFGEQEISFDRISIFFGKNESGKTAIGQAIQWCLTGVCRSQEKIGVGIKNIVKTGATEMEVRLTIEQEDSPTRIDQTPRIIEIVRKYDLTAKDQTLKIYENGQRKAVKEQQYINNLFGSQKIIDCLFDCGAFFSLPSEEQKNILTIISGVSIDKKKALELITESFGKEVSDYADITLDEKIDVSQFKSIAKKLETKRREINACIPKEKSMSLSVGSVNPNRKTEINTRISEIDDNIKKQNKYNNAQARIATLKSEKKIHSQEIKKELIPLDKNVNVEGKLTLGILLTGLNGQKENIKKYESAQEEIPQLEKRRDEIAKGLCPNIPNIECSHLKELAKTDIGKLDDKIRWLKETKMPKGFSNVDKDISDTQEKLNKIQVQETIIEKNKTIEANHSKKLQEQKSKIKSIDDEMSQLEKEVDPCIDVPGLETEKNSLNQELGGIQAQENNMEANRQLIKLIADKTAESEKLTKLIQFFSGKEGGENQSEKFLQYVSMASTKLVGGNIVINEDWDTLLDRDGVRMPINNLSDGIEIKCGIAIQYGIGMMTGKKIIMIDRFESVDEDERAVILQFLYDEDFQAIVRVVAVTAKPSTMDEMTVFKVEKSKIEVLK